MKHALTITSALLAAALVATPAMAGGWSKPKPGGSSSGSSSSSGGSTKVPEPGMLGLMGAGVLGLVIARRRRNPQ